MQNRVVERLVWRTHSMISSESLTCHSPGLAIGRWSPDVRALLAGCPRCRRGTCPLQPLFRMASAMIDRAELPVQRKRTLKGRSATALPLMREPWCALNAQVCIWQRARTDRAHRDSNSR